MRRLLDWIGGALSGILAYRLLTRPRTPEAAPVPEEPDERAEELRAKLAETRASEDTEPSERQDESSDSLEERRRRVHEEGRAAIDEMHSGEQR